MASPSLNYECCGQLAVLLGNGDGSFATARSFHLKGDNVVVGDFDGDGDLDVAASRAQDRRGIYVVLNEGSQGAKWRGFSSAHYFPVTDSRPRFLTSGDWNGDGFLDVAVTDNKFVAVLLNNGVDEQGRWEGFAERVNYRAGTFTSAVATGDVNQDGDLDLVVHNATGGDVSVFLGNGDGIFGEPTNFPGTFQGPLADVDADGDLDLVGSDRVLLGNGDGTFAELGPEFPVNIFGAQAGDLHGDGDLDILGVSVRNERNDRVRLLINNGSASFVEQEDAIARTFGNPQYPAVADLDGDGDLDVAVSTAFGGSPGNIEVFLNTTNTKVAVPGDSNGDGVFNSADLVAVFAAGEYEDAIVGNSTYEEGDWNGDDDFNSADLVFVFSQGNYVAAARSARLDSSIRAVDRLFDEYDPGQIAAHLESMELDEELLSI